MLRDPHHQRKIIKDINSPPFIPSINSGQTLSPVKGLREGFSKLLTELKENSHEV